MPTLTKRSATEVPPQTRSSKAVQEAKLQYEGFIQSVDSNVGELELGPEEQARGVKVRLRRAATRLGREIDIWDANGRVYFRLTIKRGRPRKQG
jgi:hypothetical protein